MIVKENLSGQKKAPQMAVNETSKRVIGLRTERGETQAQFASAVDVTQPMISAIEGGEEPSCALYVRLGNLAPYPDNLWFWGRAGIDGNALTSAARAISREGVADEKSQEAEGRVVLVPPFTAGGRSDRAPEPPLAIPSKFILNKEHTCYLRMGDRPVLAGRGFSPRDVVFFDTLNASTGSFKLFEKELVLVSLPDGLFIGRLDAIPYPGVGTQIVLGPFDLPAHAWGNSVVRLAEFGHTTHNIGVKQTHHSYSERLARAKAEWLSTVSISRACQVLGRVVAVFNGGFKWTMKEIHSPDS